jgi:hypothetical protein
LRFCIEYLSYFTITIHRVWYEKKDPSMYDEMLEGVWHPQVMNANIWNMAHPFVLHNAKLMAPLHR